MLTFFGTIIFVYFMWLVVKPLVAKYMRRRFQQKVNDMFRRAYGEQFGGFPFDQAGRSQQAARQDKTYRHRPHHKIFSREDGEYIEFEEIHIHTDYTSTTDNHPGNDSTPICSRGKYTPREPQISDAEWEEIK